MSPEFLITLLHLNFVNDEPANEKEISVNSELREAN